MSELILSNMRNGTCQHVRAMLTITYIFIRTSMNFMVFCLAPVTLYCFNKGFTIIESSGVL